MTSRPSPLAGPLDRNVLQERRNEAANLKFAFGRVVEYVERHLVSETAPGDELVRRDAGQNFIQPLMERVGHGERRQAEQNVSLTAIL